MKKINVKINKPVYLGMSILKISNIPMYKCGYDCVKPKYVKKANLSYINTDSFMINVKSGDIYADLDRDVKKRF